LEKHIICQEIVSFPAAVEKKMKTLSCNYVCTADQLQMSTETSRTTILYIKRRRKIEMKDTSKRRVYMHVTPEEDRKRIQAPLPANGTDDSGSPAAA